MYLVILFASLLIFVAVTFSFAGSGYFSIFHPFTLYCAFHGLVFVIRPLLAQWLDYQLVYQVYQFTPSVEDKITVIVAANLGFLTFALFCFRHGAVAMRFRPDSMLVDERNRLARMFPWVLAVCLPVGIWSLLTLYGQASNFEVAVDMGRDAATGVIYNTTGNGYLAEAQMMLVPLAALFAWLFRFRLFTLLPLVAFVVVRAGTGGRGPFIAALLAVGLFYLYEKRQRLPTLRFAAALVAGVLLFNLVGADRGQTVRALFGGQTDVRLAGSDNLRFLEGMDFANMEFFEYIVYVVPQRSHTYGYFNDVLQLFTEPVPRVLWKGKPFGAPFERFSMFDYGFPVGYTRSLPGNGWYAMGWLGVVITCGVWGYILGLIYRRFVEGSQNTFHVAAYLVFLPILIVAYRDGMIVTVFRQGIFFFAPILLWIWLARFFNVPLASQVRAALMRKRRHAGQMPDREQLAAPGEGAVRPNADRYRNLPAAVKRRRLALRR